jgi:hypothetical protein
MRKWLLGAFLALAVPVAAQAQEATPSPNELAAAACKTEKSEMGTKTWKKTYGVKSASRAKKLCLAKNGATAEDELKNAAQECKAERDTLGVDAFNEKYGTNKNKKNGYGKCVSGKAHDATEETTEDRVSAADTCKAMKQDDADGFKASFGEKRNAFGKCVSKTAKQLEESDDTEETAPTEA